MIVTGNRFATGLESECRRQGSPAASAAVGNHSRLQLYVDDPAVQCRHKGFCQESLFETDIVLSWWLALGLLLAWSEGFFQEGSTLLDRNPVRARARAGDHLSRSIVRRFSVGGTAALSAKKAVSVTLWQARR